MTTYDNTNSGIIGTNDYKTTDKHPDQKGRINVEGVWYWLSGWEKSAGGRNFMSLALTIMTQDEADKVEAKLAEKQAPQQAAQNRPAAQPQSRDAQPAQQAQAAGSNPPPADFDDDIPF